MRRSSTYIAILFALLPLAACGDSTEPDTSETFQAQLTGGAEVPPRTTAASGSAVFELDRAGTELRYTLTVNNIQNLTAAHIHTGAAGTNGPAVVFLFGPHGGPGISDPVVVKTGTITASDINPATFTGTLADLVQQMRVGNTYVNAHTTTFPGGEIRGQITTAP